MSRRWNDHALTASQLLSGNTERQEEMQREDRIVIYKMYLPIRCDILPVV
jgi:hypothetical protein